MKLSTLIKKLKTIQSEVGDAEIIECTNYLDDNYRYITVTKHITLKIRQKYIK